MSDAKRIAIYGEPGYSHAHYWTQPREDGEPDTSRCGLATMGGACRWPKEPGLPWCNSHTHRFLMSAKEQGYATTAQIEWLAQQQGLDAQGTDVLARRWARDFMTAKAPRRLVR